MSSTALSGIVKKQSVRFETLGCEVGRKTQSHRTAREKHWLRMPSLSVIAGVYCLRRSLHLSRVPVKSSVSLVPPRDRLVSRYVAFYRREYKDGPPPTKTPTPAPSSYAPAQHASLACLHYERHVRASLGACLQVSGHCSLQERAEHSRRPILPALILWQAMPGEARTMQVRGWLWA